MRLIFISFKFMRYLLSILSALVFFSLSICAFADNIHCPAIVSGSYPNKFQIPGDANTLWTLDAHGKDFIVIRTGVTWSKLSITKNDHNLLLTCSGKIDNSDRLIDLNYPVYFSPPRMCRVEPIENYFVCSL